MLIDINTPRRNELVTGDSTAARLSAGWRHMCGGCVSRCGVSPAQLRSRGALRGLPRSSVALRPSGVPAISTSNKAMLSIPRSPKELSPTCGAHRTPPADVFREVTQINVICISIRIPSGVSSFGERGFELPRECCGAVSDGNTLGLIAVSGTLW